jgi:membrane peptidoglycan carboxypeptidase
VFGAEAAAQRCFSRPASKLTRQQAALITATLPAPRRFSCSNPSGYIRGRQQWVLRQMDNVGDVLDPEVLARRKAAIEREEQRRSEREVRRKKRTKKG